jgi:hypothetical protein
VDEVKSGLDQAAKPAAKPGPASAPPASEAKPANPEAANPPGGTDAG